MSPTIMWLLVAVLAAIVEIASPIFGFIFVSAAAVVAGATAACGVSLSFQIIVFAVAVVLGLLLVRPRFVSKLGAKGVPSRTEALVGKRGFVTEQIDPVLGTGRVIVAGEDWAARSSLRVPAGTEVRVDGADSIVLQVSPINPPAASVPE